MSTDRAIVIDFAAYRATRQAREAVPATRPNLPISERTLTEREVEHRRQMLAHLGTRPLVIRALS